MKKENTNIGRRGFLKTILGTALAGTIFSSSKTSASGKWENLNSANRAYSPLDADEPFMGEIDMVAFDFAPRNWAQCNGQILTIAQNAALFSLLGTMYGGNGVNTFALPNLQGRSPLHFGQGPGLSNYSIGQAGGEFAHTLTVQEIPSHTHTVKFSSNYGTNEIPTGLAPAKNSAAVPQFSASSNTSMGVVNYSGGSQPHSNMPPYSVINFIICLAGIFPSRS